MPGAVILPADARLPSPLGERAAPDQQRALPEEEAAQLRFAFETEMARLEAA